MPITSQGPRTAGTASGLAITDRTLTTIQDDNGAKWQTGDEPNISLVLRNFGFTVPAGATIVGVEVGNYRSRSVSTGGAVSDTDNTMTLSLTKNGASATGTGTTVDYLPLLDGGYANRPQGSNADLWGTTLTPSEVNNTNFGVIFTLNKFDEVGVDRIEIDYVTVTVHYNAPDPIPVEGSTEDESLDLARIVQEGGFQCLGGEAIPDLTTAATLFRTVPTGTLFALVTVRTATMTVTFDGVTTPTTTVGNDYAVGTYHFIHTREYLKKIKAIENGGDTAGYIQYFGKA